MGEEHKRTKGSNPDAPLQTNTSSNEIEYLMELLDVCERKIRELVASIGEDTDVDAVLKEIDDSEFNALVQEKMPRANERVSTKNVPKESNFDEENIESDEDEDILTRQQVKRASKSLIDSRTNRRGNKKAHKKFR